jgi:hypothetical protein
MAKCWTTEQIWAAWENFGETPEGFPEQSGPTGSEWVSLEEHEAALKAAERDEVAHGTG